MFFLVPCEQRTGTRSHLFHVYTYLSPVRKGLFEVFDADVACLAVVVNDGKTV